MQDLKIEYSDKAPSKAILSTMLKDAQWTLSEETLLGMVRNKPHPDLRTVWVSLKKGAELIGFATLQFPSPEYKLVAPAFISNFVIKKAFQGQGLGAHLFEQIEHYCRQYGLRKIILESAATNMAFWQAVGFKRNIQNPTVLFKSIPTSK
jgi:ribosomal protein S18 acetylase RimI-like enzyme